MTLHPELSDRLKLCDTALDLPDWWVPGKHDKDLLFGAARHGISRMEYFVLNDPDLSFRDILKRHLTAEPLLDKKAMREFVERKKTWKIPDEVVKEEPAAAATEEVTSEVKKEEKEKSKADEYEFKDDEDEVEKPLEKKKDKRRKSSDKSKASEEKSESKDEDSSPKKAKKEKVKEKEKEEEQEKEESPKVEEMREVRSRRKSTKDASQATRLALEAEKVAKEMEKKEKKEKKQDKKKDKEREKDKVEEDEAKKEEEAKSKEDDFEPEQKVVNFPPSAKAKKEEEVKAAKKEEEAKKEEKPALPPKRNVTVSIPPPNITMQQMEQMAKGGMLYDMEVMNELMAQTYAAAIRWPKDKILEIRLLHLISCVEHGVWPVPDDYSLGDHLEEEVRCSIKGNPYHMNKPTLPSFRLEKDCLRLKSC